MSKTITRGFLLAVLCLTVKTANTQAPPPTAERFKQEFLGYINYYRKQGCNCGTKWFPPVPPITWNNLLAKAAYGHAKDMNDRNYFNHVSKDGRTMMTRIVQAGYYFNGYKDFTIGENIARGQQSIHEVMMDWFKSEGHCHNLMNPQFKEMGVVQYNDYWVQDFGGRQPYSAEVREQIRSGKLKLLPRESLDN